MRLMSVSLSAWFGVNNHPQRKPGRPGEELNRFRCDRPQERRHRHPLSRGRPAPARRIRGRAESRGRALAHGREVLRNARRLSEVGRLRPSSFETHAARALGTRADDADLHPMLRTRTKANLIYRRTGNLRAPLRPSKRLMHCKKRRRGHFRLLANLM